MADSISTEYFGSSAISQSQLKLLMTNPKLFNTIKEPERYFEEKRHFNIGDGVDIQLTSGMEEFNRIFHVSQIAHKPTDPVKSILNRVFDKAIELELGLTYISDERYRPFITEAWREEGYQPNWKEPTAYSKMCEHYEYWDDLRLSQGKRVLSSEENDIISQVVMSLRSNEATGKYLKLSEDRDEEVLFQLAIYFTFEDVDCRALLDVVRINHVAKVIQPIDIKTLGDYTLNFPKSLRQRRYDIQAAFYKEALEQAYPDYKILPFKFVVESTIDPGTPLVYTCSAELAYIGKYGRVETYAKLHSYTVSTYTQRNQEIKGFTQLINLYKFYTENGFEIDQRIAENNSELIIDWSGIMY